MPGMLPGAVARTVRTRPTRQHHAEHTADHHQHRRFRQRFTDDMPASRAKCQANGKIVGSRRTSHQQEATDVGAGHREEHEHGGQQGPEGRPRITEKLALQRHD